MPSAMMSMTFSRGLSEAMGSWKIICILVRSRSVCWAVRRPLTSCPQKRMRPAVGVYRRMIERPVVDLPLPLSPTRPKISPRWIVKETSSTALTV